MTDHAVISGTLVDARNIGTHKSVKLTIHVPEELAMQVFKAFGWPTMTDPVHVAIARLNGVEAPAKKGSLAQQAGILCGDPRFLTFITENYPHIGSPENDLEAAVAVRSICGVDSRAEFDADAAAGQRWRSLKGAFDAWLML